MNSTESLALPPALAQLLATPASPMTGMNTVPAAGHTPPVGLPRYEAGGLVGSQGMPQMPPAAPMPATGAGLNQVAPSQAGAPMDPKMVEMNINQIATQHPELVQQLRTVIMQEIQSGQLTPQELNQIIQLATVAAQNPEMYPYIRKFAIQQGIATEQDLPPQYDQGLVVVILLAAKAIQQDLGGQNMMQGGTPAAAETSALPAFKNGGTVTAKPSSPDGVIAEVHEGEYVIPKHVVQAKGTEFFDRMLEQYAGNK